MAVRTDILDLERLRLSSGEGRRLDLLVGVEALSYGGQGYEVHPPETPVRLDVSRTTSGGYALRLRLRATVWGPCARCLEPAAHEATVDVREVDQPGGGDELDSPYLQGSDLELGAWVRDALALALPPTMVCEPDCPGLCPACGADLRRAGPAHHHEAPPDPRWAKLRELDLE
jgi:uncharacterized protein